MSFLLQYFLVLIVSPKSVQQARNSGGISMVQSWDPIPSSENLSLCSYGLQLTGWGPSIKGRIICFTQVCLFKCCCLVTKLCLILFDLMDCSMPGSFVLHYLLEFAKIHVFWVSDVISPSHLLPSSSLPVLSLSQHRGLFQWVSSLHQVAKVLELQLQQQSFQWIFRVYW